MKKFNEKFSRSIFPIWKFSAGADEGITFLYRFFSHVYMLFYFCISQENLLESLRLVFLGIFASEVTTTACRPRFSIQEFISIFSYIYKLQHADKKS